MKTRLYISALILFTFGFSVNAYDFMVDGIAYNKTSSSTVEVTYTTNGYYNYPNVQESLVIPSMIENNGITYNQSLQFPSPK